MIVGGDLRGVPSDQLRKLIKHVYEGTLECPFERWRLMSMGLNTLADEAGCLIGLDQKAVQTVVACVLSERAGPRRR